MPKDSLLHLTVASTDTSISRFWPIGSAQGNAEGLKPNVAGEKVVKPKATANCNILAMVLVTEARAGSAESVQ